jgi:hypothetical protein
MNKKKMGTAAKNKNGVKNSLVNNINARKKKGKSRPKKKSTVSKKAYGAMQNNWGRPKKTKSARKSGKKAAKKITRKSPRKRTKSSKK